MTAVGESNLRDEETSRRVSTPSRNPPPLADPQSSGSVRQMVHMVSDTERRQLESELRILDEISILMDQMTDLAKNIDVCSAQEAEDRHRKITDLDSQINSLYKAIPQALATP